MTALTRVSGGLTLPAKILGAVLLALCLAAAAVIAGPAVARADEPAPTVEYSSDDGATWGGAEQIVWNGGLLVPGQELETTFRVRNVSGVEGFVGFAIGAYTVSEDMIATARVDVNGTRGESVALTGAGAVAPGTQVGSVHLAPGDVVTVSIVIGMPADAGNQAQNGHVEHEWAAGFTPGAAPEPEPDCVPSGSLASLGGLGSLGSLACIGAGSSGTGSFAS